MGKSTMEAMHRMYVEEKFTQQQIADHFGVSRSYVGKTLNRIGVSSITPSERYANREPSKYEFQVLVGTLLGDGVFISHQRR